MKLIESFVKRNFARSILSCIIVIMCSCIYLLSIIQPSDDSWNNNPLMFISYCILGLVIIWEMTQEDKEK